ncbi:hypothetical protein OH77DRAFT_1428835, partial [Trametes cingulata]
MRRESSDVGMHRPQSERACSIVETDVVSEGTSSSTFPMRTHAHPASTVPSPSATTEHSPAPSLARTPSSSIRAQRHAELAYQIIALQEQMRGLHADLAEARLPSDTPAPGLTPQAPPLPSKVAGFGIGLAASTPGERVMQDEIAALREEVARLQIQLEVERREVQYAVGEVPPPRYDGPPPRPLPEPRAPV